MPDSRNEDTVVTMWHGSLTMPTTFRPLSHFGTLAAARERLVLSVHRLALGTTILEPENLDVGLVCAALDIDRPLHIRDDGHEHRSVTGLSSAIVEAGVMSIQWHRRIAEMAKYRGTERASRKVAADLMREGYDHLAYTNNVENKGSISVIMLDPADIRVIRRKGMSDLPAMACRPIRPLGREDGIMHPALLRWLVSNRVSILPLRDWLTHSASPDLVLHNPIGKFGTLYLTTTRRRMVEGQDLD